MAPKVITGIRNQRPKSHFPVRMWKWSDHQKNLVCVGLNLQPLDLKRFKFNVLPPYHWDILEYFKDLLILSEIMKFGTKICKCSYNSKTKLFKILISCSIACENIKVIWPPKKKPILLGLNLQPSDFKMFDGQMFYHYTI